MVGLRGGLPANDANDANGADEEEAGAADRWLPAVWSGPFMVCLPSGGSELSKTGVSYFYPFCVPRGVVDFKGKNWAELGGVTPQGQMHDG